MITSTVATSRLKAALEKEKIEARFTQCKYPDVTVLTQSRHFDLVVPTGRMDPAAAHGVPLVMGLSFITGIGMADTVKKIVEILKEPAKE
jgi:PTS system galactitol-specific IIB component